MPQGAAEPLDKTTKTFTLSWNKGCKQSGKSLVKKVLVLNYDNSFILDNSSLFNKQTNKTNPGHQKGEELEHSRGYLVGIHHRFKGRVDIVVLRAAAVMERWEDAGKYFGLALSSTSPDLTNICGKGGSQHSRIGLKVSCSVCSSSQTARAATMEGYNLQRCTGKAD